jgi:hypothetical protein
MNTIGKILVILVFLFALVTAGLLTIVFQTRTNWKNEVEQRNRDIAILRANSAAKDEAIAALKSERDAFKADNEAKGITIAQVQAEIATVRADSKTAIDQAKLEAKFADVNLQTALAAKERMQKEAAELQKVIADREQRIIDNHAKIKQLNDLALSLDRDLKFSQERNQILVARVQELERIIAELQQGSQKVDVANISKDPTALNPPSRFVKGVIEAVDKVDPSLVRISLGTDHNVRNGNTLEVYRTNPVQYLGVIRIDDAHHHTSVGRLIRTPGTKAANLREGDTVATSLTPR